MSGAPHAHMILAALNHLGQVATHRARADAKRDEMRMELALAELRSSALAHVVDAVVTRRIEAVQQGFVQVLQEIAEQARHYMAQQERFVADELDSRDPLRRIELRKRINAIDIQLRQLRLDALMLYTRMTEVLLQLGSTSLPVDEGVARPLLLGLSQVRA